MEQYEKLIKNMSVEYNSINLKCCRISNLRLICAIVCIISVFLSISNSRIDAFFVGVGLAITFVILLIYHVTVIKKRDYIYAKMKVSQKRIDRYNGKWHEFKDTGIEFINEESHVEKDLDLFGDNSLFQYLNVANTLEGQNILASWLHPNDINEKILYMRQNAVKELIERKEVAIEIETLSTMITFNKKNTKNWYTEFVNYLKSDGKLVHFSIRLSAILLNFIIVVLFILQLKGFETLYYIGIIGVFQLIGASYFSYKNSKIIKTIYNFCINIEDYHNLINYIGNINFSSEHLQALCSKVSGQNRSLIGIKKLKQLDAAFSLQTNPLIHILLQMFFLYDIHCIATLQQWKSKYSESMNEIFDVIGEVEALLSLSVLGEHQNISFPVFENNNQIIFESDHMYHPLVSQETVISNSFYTKNGVNFITGSNMSGKTTFLRTVGINAVLAYAGAPVCAERMHLSFMKLFTSMRVQDDVSKGLSSFYAEVLRIKEIIEHLEKREPMLVLIDEIFKGTNSKDRIVGATEITKSLNKDYVILFVSTHDFELCNLVDQHEVVGSNYHFEEYYKNNKIYFDYKIKEGKCTTKNAIHILRMAGLMK